MNAQGSPASDDSEEHSCRYQVYHLTGCISGSRNSNTLHRLWRRNDKNSQLQVAPVTQTGARSCQVVGLPHFCSFGSVFADSFERCRLEKGLSDSAGNASPPSRPPGIDRPIAKKDSKWLAPLAVFYRQPLLGRRCNWLDWAAIYTVTGRPFFPVGFRLITSQHPYHPLVHGVPS